MEETTREAELGMLGCDREVFARVWSRVSAGAECPVEPLEPEAETKKPEAEEAVESGESRTLQRLILECLNEGAVYQALSRRSRRAREELSELTRRKIQQARRLSAAYFLISGVRYWPRGSVSAQPPQAFFPVLREGFFFERRMGQVLERLSRESREPELAELYGELAREAGELTYMIRLIVEREA